MNDFAKSVQNLIELAKDLQTRLDDASAILEQIKRR